MFCDDICNLLVIFQTPDIIYKICSCLNCCFCHLTFISINGDWHIKLFFQFLNDRSHSCNFFLIRDHYMSRSCRLASYINDVCAVLDHLSCMLHCLIHAIIFSTIRKGIRCYIQDSHNISFMLYVKFLSANNHIFISIFFSSSLQLHCSFTGHAKQFLERLSHS